MGVAEGTFDFDLELKKRSSLATILDKNSYTSNWIPPKLGDQAVNAHATRAQAPPYSGARVWSIVIVVQRLPSFSRVLMDFI